MKNLVREEHELLNGKWLQIYVNENGIDNPVEDHGLGTITEMYDGRFIVRTSSGTVVLEGSYEISLLKTPPQIDWCDSMGVDRGKTFKAIYRLMGNTFEFCAADENMARPENFIGRQGHTVRRFTRISEVA